MRHIKLLALVVLSLAAIVSGQRLENERTLFPAETILGEGQNPNWIARLSPDGRHLLCAKPLGDAAAADRQAQYQVVLRAVETGAETVIPIPPVAQGFHTVFTRFNCFDPAGKRLSLLQLTPPAQGQRGEMEIVLYDIASKQLTRTGLKGPMTFARFDRTGQRLIRSEMESASLVALPDLKVTKLTAPGWVQSGSLASDLVTIHARMPRPQPQPLATAPTTRQRSMRLILWDIAADKQLIELPTHERNTMLDDVEAQWTADGRYVAYVDLQADAANPQQTKRVAHIWDTKENRIVATVNEATPIGPLDQPRIAMSRRQGAAADALVVDCAKPDQFAPLNGGAPMELVHASGDQVVYIKDANGVRTLMIARVAPR